MDSNWNGVREIEKLIHSFRVGVEEGLDYVDHTVTQTKIGLDLLSKLVELLLVEVLAIKGNISKKKPKFVLGNSLKRYFYSTCNANNPSTLWMPKKTSATPSQVLIPTSSIASSSPSNLAIQLLPTSR